ncbi:MAG: L-threonylcarbamoyladenylate synthase [Candidatus Altiarchaeota archaeon]
MNPVLDASAENIEAAADIVRKGGVVISPTDSVYGLFCDATNENAVSRIRDIKGRDGKPLQVAIQKKDAEKYGLISKDAEKIIKEFWPGDVNIIVEKTSEIPEYVSKKTVCLTCHKNKVAAKLVELSGKPLISTSANYTGKTPAAWAGEIDEMLATQVDIVLDGGATHHKKPNTIIDLTVKPARILRQGPVDKTVIASVIEVD